MRRARRGVFTSSQSRGTSREHCACSKESCLTFDLFRSELSVSVNQPQCTRMKSLIETERFTILWTCDLMYLSLFSRSIALVWWIWHSLAAKLSKLVHPSEYCNSSFFRFVRNRELKLEKFARNGEDFWRKYFRMRTLSELNVWKYSNYFINCWPFFSSFGSLRSCKGYTNWCYISHCK